MTLSDLLTVIAIIVAALAIIPEQNKELILHKITTFDWAIIGAFVLLIHWLIAFQWFQAKFSSLDVFVISGWPNPEVWAYIFAVFLMGFIFYKIAYADFPLKNIDKVKNLYFKLILNKEYDKLIKIISTYHQEQVVAYIAEIVEIEKYLADKYPDLGSPNTYHLDKMITSPVEETERREILTEKGKGKVFSYGSLVFKNCYENDEFMNYAANKDPYLFLSAISEYTFNAIRNSNFTSLYVESLIINNNIYLNRELKHIDQVKKDYRDNIEDEFYSDLEIDISDETPILESLFTNIDIALRIGVFGTVGKVGSEDIDDELRNPKSILWHVSPGSYHFSNDEIWNLPIKKAVVLIDIMVKIFIISGRKYYIYTWFYSDYISKLSSDSFSNKDSDPTRSDQLVSDMIDNTLKWVEFMIYYNNTLNSASLMRSINQIIEVILKSNVVVINKYYNRIWYLFADLIGDSTTERILSKQFQKQFLEEMEGLVKKISNNKNTENKRVIFLIKEHWYSLFIHEHSGRYFSEFHRNYEAQVIQHLNDNQ